MQIARGALIVFLAALLAACQDRADRSARVSGWIAPGEHETLAGSFVDGDSAGLRRLLHADFLVQPPEPDSALQGTLAVDYLLQLATSTSVDESRLVPMTITPEGPFAFEQGFWHLRIGGHELRSPYTLRWRDTPEGWKVVLWRWGPFR